MFKRAHDWNTTRTWLLRGLGLFLMFIGLRLVLDPVAAVFGILPIFGSFLQAVVGAGVTLAAGALAISLTFVVCSTAWFWYRPILSITLLACATLPYFVMPGLRQRMQQQQPGARRAD
eukprot:TRINITY_DN3043_c0_g2_i1.p1 TRINITY_DN3043_c0_g2~~TRINITY_DN3043_c0_g2_i1.p1  ORF type:complete len:118 (-),score=45.40 TRINITY_DN3043_c0_g2_i1:134-487(-)